jgi:hypothetical protein
MNQHIEALTNQFQSFLGSQMERKKYEYEFNGLHFGPDL